MTVLRPLRKTVALAVRALPVGGVHTWRFRYVVTNQLGRAGEQPDTTRCAVHETGQNPEAGLTERGGQAVCERHLRLQLVRHEQEAQLRQNVFFGLVPLRRLSHRTST